MKSRELCTFLVELFATTFQTRFKSLVHETALTLRGWPKARDGCKRRSTPTPVSTRWLDILLNRPRYEHTERQDSELTSIAA